MRDRDLLTLNLITYPVVSMMNVFHSGLVLGVLGHLDSDKVVSVLAKETKCS
jgi:hypothetical protein